MIVLIILGLLFLAFVLDASVQAWSELNWRLEKYGATARVPKWMKKQYLKNKAT